MTKSEYLAKLDKYLKKLPKEDYLEAMDYFREYFDEAGPENEEEVIAELGAPKDAAHDIISRLLDEKIVEDEKSPKNRAVIIWIAILAILAQLPYHSFWRYLWLLLPFWRLELPL